MHGIEEDNALQVLEDLLLRFAGQLHHVRHIHLCFFSQRQGQRLRSSIHRSDDDLLLDGALGEHIRLADKIAFIVQDFQGTQKAERTIRRKGRAVGAGVEDAILLGKLVIKLV